MVLPRIVTVVVPDNDLRHSLEFALAVEGYDVDAHGSLSEAETSPASTAALCMVVDEGALDGGQPDRQALKRLDKPLILLVNRLPAMAGAKNQAVLTKPLRGNDLIDLIEAYAAA